MGKIVIFVKVVLIWIRSLTQVAENKIKLLNKV